MYRRRVELCLNECKGGDKILEVGFGTGLAFLVLADKYKEIHGVDLTSDVEAVGEAFQGIGLTTYLKNGDVLQLPYPDETFDCVLLISIREHLHLATSSGLSQKSSGTKTGRDRLYMACP